MVVPGDGGTGGIGNGAADGGAKLLRKGWGMNQEQGNEQDQADSDGGAKTAAEFMRRRE